jgi:hypothetical protein
MSYVPCRKPATRAVFEFHALSGGHKVQRNQLPQQVSSMPSIVLSCFPINLYSHFSHTVERMMDKRDSTRQGEEQDNRRRHPLALQTSEDGSATPPGEIRYTGMAHKPSKSFSPDRRDFSRIQKSSTDGEGAFARERSSKRKWKKHSSGSESRKKMVSDRRASAHPDFGVGDRQPEGLFKELAESMGNLSPGEC